MKMLTSSAVVFLVLIVVAFVSLSLFLLVSSYDDLQVTILHLDNLNINFAKNTVILSLL